MERDVFLGLIKSRNKVRILAYEKIGYYAVLQPVHATVEKTQCSISTVRSTVRTYPSRRSFSKKLFKKEEFNFCVDENLENGGSQVICLTKFPSNNLKHKSQMTFDCSVFKFLRFRSENARFKILQWTKP